MKWFINIETLDELRKVYRKLAFENHPDKGGDVSKMQEINNEYEKLSASLINGNVNFTESRKSYEHNVSKEMKIKIDEILNIENIIIEVMGSWLWITGNTFYVKEELKKYGFKFSHNKLSWYWHCDDYVKKSKRIMSLDEIRDLWGSEKINSENAKKQMIVG